MLARAVPLPVAVAALGAEQYAGLPPPEPVQVQAQGDAALTALAVPVVHKPLTGLKAVAAMLAQTPLTAAALPVVTLKAALLPPMVSVAVVRVLPLPDALCCTVTVSPLLTVALLVT